MKNKRHITVLISEADIVGNKGAVAMVHCLMTELIKLNSDIRFIVTTKNLSEAQDQLVRENGNITLLFDNEQAFDIPLIKLWIWWFGKKIGLNLDFLLDDKVLKSYMESDLILSTSGISFIDDFGLIKIYHFSKYLQIPLLMGKKVIKITQSIGPFYSRYNRYMAKRIFRNLNTIISRGRFTTDNLSALGVTNNVITLPDIAFTLIPEPIQKLNNTFSPQRTLIGISPNSVCVRLDKNDIYVQSLIDLSCHILAKYDDVDLLLIPHTIIKSTAGVDDDLAICNQIMKAIQPEKNIRIEDTTDYSPEEIKWLIGQCDFFIGSRFHSLVAAISMSIPSIAIGWEKKYEELMEWAEIENNILLIDDLTISRLHEIFTSNYQHRIEITKKLNYKSPWLKTQAYKAIEIVSNAINEIN